MSGATVGSIIADYLNANGFDGLAGNECGCKTGEMFLCDLADANCKPAHYVTCDKCDRRRTDTCIYPGDECDGCFFSSPTPDPKETS